MAQVKRKQKQHTICIGQSKILFNRTEIFEGIDYFMVIAGSERWRWDFFFVHSDVLSHNWVTDLYGEHLLPSVEMSIDSNITTLFVYMYVLVRKSLLLVWAVQLQMIENQMPSFEVNLQNLISLFLHFQLYRFILILQNEKTTKRSSKRGRKPSKVDVKVKLERSRQSARECRARKKLRYQYLEELVASRERAIYTLRDELEKVSLSFCIISTFEKNIK